MGRGVKSNSGKVEIVESDSENSDSMNLYIGKDMTLKLDSSKNTAMYLDSGKTFTVISAFISFWLLMSLYPLILTMAVVALVMPQVLPQVLIVYTCLAAVGIVIATVVGAVGTVVLQVTLKVFTYISFVVKHLISFLSTVIAVGLAGAVFLLAVSFIFQLILALFE